MNDTRGSCDGLMSKTLDAYCSRGTQRKEKQSQRYLPVSLAVRRERRRRLSIEILEDRRLLASLFYWANDEQIELVEQTDTYAIKLANSQTQPILSDLTSGDGALADYHFVESIATDTWRIEKSSPIGPFIAPSVDPKSFQSPGVEWLTSSFKTTEGDHRIIVVDELIVGLRDGIDPDSYFSSLHDIAGDFEVRPLLGTPDQFVLTLAGRTGTATIELANQLHEESRLSYAAPNTYQNFKRYFVPNDTLFGTQWHLNNTGQVTDAIAGADVKAVGAWDVSTGVGVTIAVIDDGIERTHPDLAANIFVNAGEIPSNFIDDDGNGYIDDVSGWSFTANSPNPTVGSLDKHGTSVAGVAAGVGNNNLGVTGVAFNAKILPVQIFNGSTYVGDAGAASAVYYAAGRTANGLGTWNAAQVINCSWGGGSTSTTLTNAFTWASNTARSGKGVATFISSGNDYSGSVSYPARLSSTLGGVMAVGASNHRDTRSEYSNYGVALDFVASSGDIDLLYTVGITTTDRTGSAGYSTGNYTNNTTANGFGGTSSASPLAAGVGALLLSISPNLKASDVKSILRTTADKVGSVFYGSSGFDLEYGYGRINATAALQMNVMSVSPTTGSTFSTIPNPTGGYLANFSLPYDPNPASVDLSKVTVNGISPIGFRFIDGDTLQFDFASSPVTAEGIQTFFIAGGAVKRLIDGVQVSSFGSTFRYDAVALQVLSIAPPTNETLALPSPFNLDIVFNESIAPGTIGTDDLSLSVGTVTSAVPINANTARYIIDGLTKEGALSVSLFAGRVTDVHGTPSLNSFFADYTTDFGTVAFPTPLTAEVPAGALIHEGSVTGQIGTTIDADNFTLSVDAGQSISVLISPTTSLLQSRIELFDPANQSISFSNAPAANQSALIQTVFAPSNGTYRISVSSLASSTGSYSLNVKLNAAYELEGPVVGSANNTNTTAQNIDSSFVGLNTSFAHSSRGAVSGNTNVVPGAYTPTALTPIFTNISVTGNRSTTAVGSLAFDTLTPEQLNGFAFPFYGNTYNSLSFSVSGLITFNGGDSTASNDDLTNGTSKAAIAVLWDSFFIEGIGEGTASKAIFWKIVGSGASQQLIVQWNNVRQFSGTTYFTFQAVLSLDGTIQLNYSSSVVSIVLVSATVGIKAVGTGNPARLLIQQNQANGPFVGPNMSTRLTPALATGDTNDYYQFDLTAGSRVSLALSSQTYGKFDVKLIGTDGATVLANGIAGTTVYNVGIQNVSIVNNGTYFARVTANTSDTYNLVVAKDAVFDFEKNNTFATAQSIQGNQGAVGSLNTAQIAPKLNATDTGWVRSDGNHLSTSREYAVGLRLSGSLPYYFRNYATFAIPATTPSFDTAELRLLNPSTGYNSVDPTETYSLFDVSTSIANLDTTRSPGNTTGIAIYNDLGSGVVFGARDLSLNDNGKTVAIELSTNAVTALNARRGTSFSIGGTLTTIVGSTPQSAFEGSIVGAVTDAQLVFLNQDSDWYSFNIANAGDQLRFETRTPADGSGEPFNNINPRIELYRPDGTLLASGLPLSDGRNEFIQIIDAPVSGTYRVRVNGEAGTQGEYFLAMNVGNTPPTASNNLASQNTQYSDSIAPVTISSTDAISDVTTASTTFSVDGGSSQAGLPSGLNLVANGILNSAGGYDTRTWTLDGFVNVAPGSYVIVIAITDSEGSSSSTNVTIVVSQEHANASYSGPLFISTPSIQINTVNIPLLATIRDISAVENDPNFDNSSGIISNAKATFKIYDSSNALVATLANADVSLDNPLNPTIGTAHANWEANLGNGDGETYRVEVLTSGYYSNGIQSDQANTALVTVARLQPKFITGGGKLLSTNSIGTYAAELGTKIHFGFNIKFDDQGLNLLGETEILWVHGSALYAFTSTSLQSLVINPLPGKREVIAAGSLADVTNPLSPTSIANNLTLHLVISDNDETGASDTLGISLRNSSNAILFDSHWDGSNSIEQTLAGGNVKIQTQGSMVVNRQVFYNRSNSSIFGDGSGNPINATDATKIALLPGQVAGFANYTNYVNGLNGLIVDVADLPTGLSSSDFTFATWNGIDALGFTASSVTPIITTIIAGGQRGTDRVKIEFDNRAISNQWLQITLLSNANTGLLTKDVFYFGNAIADTNTGNFGSPVTVETDDFDLQVIRQNQLAASNSVDIANVFDVNKDGQVNPLDMSMVQQNKHRRIFRLLTAPLYSNLLLSSLSASEPITIALKNSPNAEASLNTNDPLSVPMADSTDRFFAELSRSIDGSDVD